MGGHFQKCLEVINSGITPDRAQETIWGIEGCTQVQHVQGKCPPCCTISPALLYFQRIPLKKAFQSLTDGKEGLRAILKQGGTRRNFHFLFPFFLVTIGSFKSPRTHSIIRNTQLMCSVSRGRHWLSAWEERQQLVKLSKGG